jgi:UDP-N-acetylmuramate dehydrogenase
MEIEYDISLKPYNTFAIDVKASKLIRIYNKRQLFIVFRKEKDVFILGGGSNLLFTEDIEQPIVKIETKGIECVSEDENSVLVKVEAGEVWDDFVYYTLKHGWFGLENLSLIPGSVGASPVQNIGAFGTEVKDTITSVEVFDIKYSFIFNINANDCGFGYRDSHFKNIWAGRYIITAVTFRLSKVSNVNISYAALQQELNHQNILVPTPEDVRECVIRVRKSKLPDPEELGNAGSFFKNPVIHIDMFSHIQKEYPDVVIYPVDEKHKKLAAGWLIEKAGWKGVRYGNVGVHEKQALVIVNYGNATSQMIIELAEQIIESVLKKFGVRLEPEVRFVANKK